MSETASLLADAATRLFEEHLDETAMRAAASGRWPETAWRAIEDMGLPLALLDADRGGFGVEPADALGLLRLVGFHAAALPIGETMLANAWFARAGLPLCEGAAAIVPPSETITLERDPGGWRLRGTAARVPWSGALGTLLVAVGNGRDGRIVRLAAGQWRTITTGINLAGHPRDTIEFDLEVESVGAIDAAPLAGLAALRTILIAGALDRVLALTVGHVNERVQFGRTLAKFQAVQHECAELAGEVAAAGAAADIAIDALIGGGPNAVLAIAAAKLRAGESVGRAVGLAHQLHGAIGFTAEHRLHLYTTALWAWREEYGGHGHWARILGERALAAGADGFWPLLTEI